MKEYIYRDFTKDNSKFLPNLKNTKDLLLNVDFVLSPLSTILLEAMMLGKIPICLMPEDEINAGLFHMVKNSPHFEEILANLLLETYLEVACELRVHIWWMS